MKTRAAVAFAAKQPLEILEVDLEGPKAGEVLVEIKATGICHTDAYTLDGLDSEGIFPSILGHEGAGVVLEVGAGVTTLKPGDHVIPLYTPECRQCKSCLSQKTNLCTAIRATQGKGVMPDGTSRFSIGKEPDSSPTTWAARRSRKFSVMPEIAVAKIREDAPFDKVCYIGCGVTTGIGAVIKTAKSRGGRQRGCVRPRWYWTQRGAGRSKWWAPTRSLAWTSTTARRYSAREEIRHDALRQPLEGSARAIWWQHLVELTGGGADYSFECVGNVNRGHAPPRSSACHRGWGTFQRHRRSCRAPARKLRPGRSSWSPAGCGKARPSAARAAAPTCPKSSTGT